MAEYIEREAAKKAMCRMCEGGAKLVCGTLNDCCTTMRIFDSIPAADVRPVVVNAKLTKPSNADLIRGMTDEELLFFLWWFADGSGKTKDQWLEWLKQEAK